MHPNGQLPAYEWDVRRRQPAGARLGRAAGLRDRRPPRDHHVPRAHLPQAAAQLHLVGEPQGRRRQQRVRGRLPRPRQHRPDRPLGAAARSRAASSSPTARRGWPCTASTCWRSPSCWPSTTESYEDMATKFFEHFAYIATAIHDRGLWDEEDGFYYDVLRLRGGERVPLRVRSMVGLLPLCATTTLGQATLDRLPDFAGHFQLVRRATSRSSPTTSSTRHRLGEGTRAGCSSIVGPERLRPHPRPPCSTSRRVPVAPRPAVAVGRQPPRRSRSTVELGGMTLQRRLRAGRVARPGCSAATPTGGARSGSRSTTCVVEALRALRPLLRRRPHRRAPDRLGPPADPRPRSPTTSPAASSPSSSTTPTAAARCFGDVRAASRPTPRWHDADPVPRVLPRRHRRGPRRLPPDRLDRPRRRPASLARGRA